MTQKETDFFRSQDNLTF